MVDKDTQLELKKRARRRLVGAVALAVAGAIVLPMVMEKEPKPVGQDIQVRIPSQDSAPKVVPAKPETAENKPSVAAAPATTPAAPSPPATDQAKSPEAKPPEQRPGASSKSEAAGDPPVAPPRKEDKGGDKSAEKSTDRSQPKAEAKPAKTEAKAESKTETKAEPKADAKTEQARARAILEGSDQYVLQLGSFADSANAKKIQERVKAEGYNSYTETFRASDGAAKTRVRVGPFDSREAAEKARGKLKRIGVDGIVASRT